jgi:hypothetical protein
MIRPVIARAVRLAQATSSTTSILVLIGFNLVPLVGVLFGRWSVATLLVLYWVENGIVGVLNVPKILLAEGSGRAPTAGGGSVAGLGRPAVGPAGRLATALFFLLHYGMFWLVHGIFVWTLPTFAALGGSAGAVAPDGSAFTDVPLGGFGGFAPARATGVDGSAVVWGAIGLAISHGISFVVNYLGRGEYRKVTPQEQAGRPYGRLVLLHLAIIFGGFVSLLLGSPLGSIVVLVVLKTALDVALHRREHDGLAARSAPG